MSSAPPSAPLARPAARPARSANGRLLERSPELVLIAITLLWGSTFVVTKEVVSERPPLVYLSLRFAIASLLLLALHRGTLGAGRALWRDGLWLGLGQGVGLLLQVTGQVYTTASKSAFVTSLATALTPLVSFVLDGTRPTRAQAAAITLATVGLGLLTYPAEGARWNRGDLYSAACAVVYAGVIVETARRARRHPSGELTTAQTVIATLLFVGLLGGARAALALLPPGLVPEVLALERRPVSWDLPLALQVGYMASVCTALTFLGQTWAMARLSATHAAVIFALEPVMATALAIAVRGGSEWPGGRGALGATLVLAGVLAAEVPRMGRRREDGLSFEDGR